MRPDRVAEPDWSAWMLPSIYGVKLNRHRALLAEAERARLARLTADQPAGAVVAQKAAALRELPRSIAARWRSIVGPWRARSAKGSAQ